MLTLKGTIPITIHPIFFLVAVLIGWLNTSSLMGTGIWTAIIFISVLVHEFGHALTARYFGQKANIELVGLGGLTQRQGNKLKGWQEFLVVFNGPCAGLLLGILALFLLRRFQPVQPIFVYALQVSIYVNFFWTAINLLPIQPLDGGQLFSLILEGIFGFRGLKMALFVSIILATLLSLVCFVFQMILAGALFLMLAFESFRTWKASLSVTEQDRSVDLQNMLQEAEMSFHEGRKEQAKHLFQIIREVSKSGLIYCRATETYAKLLYEEGDLQAAFSLLLSLKKQLSPDALQFSHQLACQLGQWQAAVDLGDRAYQQSPQAEVAMRNAIAYAALHQARPALGWLQRAQRDGVSHLKELVERSEFDFVRQDSAFRTWFNSLS